jgi:hypothetical protein
MRKKVHNGKMFDEKGFNDEVTIIYVISIACMWIYVLTIFSADWFFRDGRHNGVSRLSRTK